MRYLITIGDSLRFEDGQIEADSISFTTAVDVVSSELSVDAFSVVVRYSQGEAWLWSPADKNGIVTSDWYLFASSEEDTVDLSAVEYGTPLLFYMSGELHDKFYIKNIVRVGSTRYKINAISAIGFLDNQKHMGGLYSNVKAGVVLTDIIGGIFEYRVAPDVASQTVVGWLPIDKRRNNLHKLMFALGFSLTKDADGVPYFSYLRGGDGVAIPDDRIFIGGSVDYQSPATGVEVTEHSYFALQSDEEEQLFDNSGQFTADGVLVEFSEPHHDLVASSGLTIDSYGVNYAVVSGVGSLTGKKYTHNTRTNSHYLENAGSVANVVTSSKCTLVNALNSENVAQRLLAYYSSRKTVKADIKLSGEKSGDLIRFNDAFGDQSRGFIAQIDVAASSFLRASCQIITDYVPTGQGNNYKRRVFRSANGSWTVPSGVKRIRIVLIGGGNGGSGGYDGEDGKGIEDMTHRNSNYGGNSTDLWQYNDGRQSPSAGGLAGEAGASGKLFAADYDVSGGEVLTFTIGAGGAGGAANGGAGAEGAATSVTSTTINATSADGIVPRGYADPLTGIVYAAAGEAGHNGASGGMTDVVSLAGYAGNDGFPGEAVGSYSGGAGGAGYKSSGENLYLTASGGGGGGAAYGANGGDGSFGSFPGATTVFGGNGGAGADAIAPSTPSYGGGGGGGNGGGGGGNAAGAYAYAPMSYSVYIAAFPGQAGAGGKGSVGGNGGNGCVIVYY